MFFLFLTCFHPILCKNNSSVSRNFLPKHVNRHSKQSIYETNIFNIFNDFKKFLTIFNSSVDYNFVFSHSFKFYANFDDNLVIPECILMLYTELATVLLKLRNVFFDNFDYQKLWKTIALIVCFNSCNFSQQIYRIFIVSISSLIWLKKIPVLLFISSLLMPRLKVILTGIAFLVCILYRFSKPYNRLKSCFACQFFTHDAIEITNKVNTSHFQSKLSIFAI